MTKKINSKAVLETPLGFVLIEGDEQGISRINIEKERPEISSEVPEILQEAVEQIELYFSGELKEFDLKLNPEGTPFQKRIWKLLMEIPFGRRKSYMDLAREYGDTKAIRAVAAANGKNPLWIVVPCHRVVGSDGSLTGYAGGIWRKKWLLDHEVPVKQKTLF